MPTSAPTAQPIQPFGAAHLRGAFLRMIAKESPNVLESLCQLMPLYRAVPDNIRDAAGRGPLLIQPANFVHWFFYDAEVEGIEIATIPDIVIWKNLEGYALECEKALRLRNALHDWATSYNIACEWVLNTALQTLHHWNGTRDAETGAGTGATCAGGDLKWAGLPGSPPFIISEEERSFTFSDDGWAAELEGWDDFEGRLRESFCSALQQYRDRILTIANAKGWDETPETRSEDHMAWLVQYQIGRLSPDGVANKAKKLRSGNAVYKAVQNIAEKIGLPLRPRRPATGPRRRARK